MTNNGTEDPDAFARFINPFQDVVSEDENAKYIDDNMELSDDDDFGDEKCSHDTDHEMDPKDAIKRERAHYRAVRKCPLIVAVAKFEKLRTERPDLSADELVSLAPDLRESLSPIVVGWSKNGIVLRSTLLMNNTHNALLKLESEATKLIELERKYEHTDSLLCDDSVEIQRIEDEIVADAVSTFLCGDNTPPKKLRSSGTDLLVRTEMYPQNLGFFFQNDIEQQQQKRGTKTYPLFRTEFCQPSLMLSKRIGRQFGSRGRDPQRHSFVANRAIKVHGAAFTTRKDSSEHGSSNTPQVASAEVKIPSRIDNLLDFDVLQWENDIIWDSSHSLSQSFDQKEHGDSRRTKEEQFFDPPEYYCNPQIESGEWVNSIAWDVRKGPNRTEVPVVYDLNDPNIFFIVGSECDKSFESESGDLSLKRKKDDVLNDEFADKVFNVSHDSTCYSSLQEKKRFGVSGVNHGIPALNLSVFPTKVTYNDLANFHRPKFVADDSHPGPFGVVLGMNPKHFRNVESNPKKMKYLSAMSGDMVLLEHLERYPTLISAVAMGSCLRTYYRKTRDDDFSPFLIDSFEGELVVLEPLDDSPFGHLGEVQPGSSVVTVENNMTKMPVARHSPESTDFLLVQTTNGRWCIRELGPVFLAGQEFPQMVVPAPGSYLESRLLSRWISSFMLRTFLTCPSHARFKAKEFFEAFEQRNNFHVRTILRKFCKCNGGNAPTWKVKRDAPFPSEQELRSLITPEEVCAYNAMKHGIFLLYKEGIRFLFDEHSVRMLLQSDATLEQHKKIEQIYRAVSVSPWTTTSAYMEFVGGKTALVLFGEGDPLTRCEGFSFVPSYCKQMTETTNPAKSEREHSAAANECHQLFERMLVSIRQKDVPGVESVARLDEFTSELSKYIEKEERSDLLEEDSPSSSGATSATKMVELSLSSLFETMRKINLRGASKNQIIEPSQVTQTEGPTIPCVLLHAKSIVPHVSMPDMVALAETTDSPALAVPNVDTKEGSHHHHHHHHHHRSHHSKDTREPPSKRMRRGMEPEGFIIDSNQLFPKPQKLSIIERLIMEEVAWSDELVNTISALSPLDKEMLTGVCLNRYRLKSEESEIMNCFYELCWNISHSDMNRAKEEGFLEAIRLCKSDNDNRLSVARRKSLHSVVISGRFPFCMDFASAVYEVTEMKEKKPNEVPPADVEAVTILHDADKRRRFGEFSVLAQDSGSRGENKASVFLRGQTNNLAVVGMKRSVPSGDVYPLVGIQPCAKQGRKPIHSRTCVDETEAVLHELFALSPPDNEGVNSFIIRVPDAIDLDNSENMDGSMLGPKLEPCKVHLTFVPLSDPALRRSTRIRRANKLFFDSMFVTTSSEQSPPARSNKNSLSSNRVRRRHHQKSVNQGESESEVFSDSSCSPPHSNHRH